MRSIKVAVAFVGCVLPACGFSQDEALFGNVPDKDCRSVGCGSPSMGGAGGVDAGDPSVAGGPSASGGNVGAGGRSGSGGVAAGGHGDAASGGAPGPGAVSCPEGSYHAVLTGSYRSLAGSNDVGATIDFSIIASGAMTGTFASRGGAKATVTGSVDCDAHALGARIEDGTYQIGPTMARFSGTLDGTYDPGTGAFEGTWTITEPGSSTNGGTGPWSAR